MVGQSGLRSVRNTVYALLSPDKDDGLGLVINWLIMGLITANVAAVMLSTVDAIATSYETFFTVFERLSVAIFTLEYVGRVWSIVEAGENRWHPISSRLRFITKPLLIVDLVAILPFYLALLGFGVDLRFLRALRLIRLLRLLKLVRYSETMRAFGFAFRSKRDQLIVAFTANILLLIIASSLMFFAETAAQPDVFGSIPETMWWAIVTLTTVGYGDVAPVTPLGRAIGGLVALLGVGLFALPASILASGFIQESSFETTYCPDCGHEIDWERDIGGMDASFEDGDWVRIDVTAESNVRYALHGVHGRLELTDREMLDRTDLADSTEPVTIDVGDDTVSVPVKSLRSPHLPEPAVEF